jgi:hypothetical protein
MGCCRPFSAALAGTPKENIPIVAARTVPLKIVTGFLNTFPPFEQLLDEYCLQTQ